MFLQNKNMPIFGQTKTYCLYLAKDDNSSNKTIHRHLMKITINLWALKGEEEIQECQSLDKREMVFKEREKNPIEDMATFQILKGENCQFLN